MIGQQFGNYRVLSLLGEGGMGAVYLAEHPGIGRLAVDSIGGRDYPVVQAIVLVSALSFMVTTLLVDILYGWLDPRISYGGAAR